MVASDLLCDSDRLLDRFMKTQREHNKNKVRRAYYLSMEYLMGRLLTNNLYNSGYHDMVRDVLTDLGKTLMRLLMWNPTWVLVMVDWVV